MSFYHLHIWCLRRREEAFNLLDLKPQVLSHLMLELGIKLGHLREAVLLNKLSRSRICDYNKDEDAKLFLLSYIM